MPSGKKQTAEDRAKVGIPCDVLYRFDVLMRGIDNRIMKRACMEAAKRKVGPQAWSVTDDDVWLSACQELREMADVLESQLDKNAKRSLRIRHAS